MDELLLTKEGEDYLSALRAKNGSEVGAELCGVSRYTGCTATVILISKDNIYCANAGDSRTVLARSSGAKMC